MISIEGLQSENRVGSNIPISANPALQQSFAIVSPAELCVRLHKDTLYGTNQNLWPQIVTCGKIIFTFICNSQRSCRSISLPSRQEISPFHWTR
ncbi:hypothetical protein BN873_470064 [Candidatus Competibacter denitrificans Run_A_D11]|uniref:Uncharacterized protein n=1 Tax=Candidatus Competibacter denitrificans Run_A_D11 TaxID=1400863 RepID=W6M6L4_9GAMM|nr:hypothetical protein BN873_470064 [Candidatus Competibacter denitrificans Run_A_D11]